MRSMLLTVGMIESRRGTSFAPEAFQRLGVTGQVFGQELQSDQPFTEVRKVWRNTKQSMCGRSGFFEQFFPLVRAVNQKLTPTKRLRVLAGDPPIDWDHVKTSEDGMKFFDREPSIVSVMEKEVLSKHRKALMLYGSWYCPPGHQARQHLRDQTWAYQDSGFWIGKGHAADPRVRR
jgi:hypothetical protein